jgi:hypothetical protein
MLPGDAMLPTEAEADQLDHAWDVLVAGGPVDFDLDPRRAAMIRRLHGLGHVPTPDLARERAWQRVEASLDHAHATEDRAVNQTRPFPAVLPASNGREPAPTLHPAATQPRRLWLAVEAAAVAVLFSAIVAGFTALNRDLPTRSGLLSFGDEEQIPAADMTTPVPPASPVTSPMPCPVTLANGSTPPGERPSPGYHGNGALSTALWPNGRVVFEPGGPGSVEPDGSLSMKWPWWWDVGRQLTIKGRRLDGAAPPLRAEAPGGRRLDVPPSTDSSTALEVTRFQATALIFPSEGCWEVTGNVGDASLTFVVLVVKVGEGPDQRPAATPEAATAPRPQVTVREGSGPLPDGCTPEDVADLKMGFLDAFNRGDQAALTAFFPAEAKPPGAVEPGEFHWFSAPGFVAYSRDQLLPYFAERHAQHERLQLLQLEVSTSWHLGVDIVYDIARQADDIPAHVAGGKGAIDCEERTIFVWSMGDHENLPNAQATLAKVGEAPPPAQRPHRR